MLVDGVLFSGDIAMKPQPSFTDPTALISHWLESLDELEAMKPKKIVPSHGPFGGVEIIAGYRSYLTRIRNRAAELKKSGKGHDEVIQVITEEIRPGSIRTRLGSPVRSTRPTWKRRHPALLVSRR